MNRAVALSPKTLNIMALNPMVLGSLDSTPLHPYGTSIYTPLQIPSLRDPKGDSPISASTDPPIDPF